MTTTTTSVEITTCQQLNHCRQRRMRHTVTMLMLPLMLMTLKPPSTTVSAFLPQTRFQRCDSTSFLSAKPRRLEENVEGPLYVNDRVSDEQTIHLYGSAFHEMHSDHPAHSPTHVNPVPFVTRSTVHQLRRLQ